MKTNKWGGGIATPESRQVTQCPLRGPSNLSQKCVFTSRMFSSLVQRVDEFQVFSGVVNGTLVRPLLFIASCLYPPPPPHHHLYHRHHLSLAHYLHNTSCLRHLPCMFSPTAHNFLFTPRPPMFSLHHNHTSLLPSISARHPLPTNASATITTPTHALGSSDVWATLRQPGSSCIGGSRRFIFNFSSLDASCFCELLSLWVFWFACLSTCASPVLTCVSPSVTSSLRPSLSLRPFLCVYRLPITRK